MSEGSLRARPGIWAVAALVLACLLASAGLRPLMLPDEGRYVGVAWEMLQSGNWLTPTLDGLPFFHKPPLFYWLTAAALQAFGPHAWAARVAPLLGATLGAWALYLFTRRHRDEATARDLLKVLLAQPLFYLGGQFANLDMLVAGCITATIVLLAHAITQVEHGRPAGRALPAAYGVAALGVLAKGLIGFVLPGLVITLWLLLRRRPRLLLAVWSGWGVVLFGVVAVPWFVAMQGRYAGFLDYFFVVQHFKRYTGGGFNNVQPFWFYPALLLLAFLPGLRLLTVPLQRDALTEPTQGPLRLLMAVWALTVLLFFSMASSKLVGYVLPALPPIAYLIADGRRRRIATAGRPGPPWRWRSALALGLALSLGTIAWLTLHPVHSTADLARTLRERRGDGEPIYLLEGYDYDVPFYAGLTGPVAVVDSWQSPEVQARDNWRKELADASRFTPPAQADATLVEATALAAALCRARVAWVVGPEASGPAPGSAGPAANARPYLTATNQIAVAHRRGLWRVDAGDPATASALGCR